MATRTGDGEGRYATPRLFDPVDQRSEAHVADLRELADLFEDGQLFFDRELQGSRATASYQLRRSGLTAVLRHGSRDLGVVDELFRRRFYDLPPEVETILSSLGRPPRVTDLGAHIGLFGVWLLERFPGASVAAFEPDRFNSALLRRCVDANAEAGRWEVIEAVASTADGSAGFVDGDFASSRMTAPGESGAAVVPQVDAVPHLMRADLAKLDIEGGEWPLLGDERFRASPPAVLALEYHPHLCPGDRPREEAERLLEAAGLHHRRSLFERSDGVGMLWAWRT
jgi:FkbM family methyltransferase